MKFPPKKQTKSRERKPRERVHRKKDPKKVKKVKTATTPKLPPIASPQTPQPTVFGEKSEFIAKPSLSPLRLLRSESEHTRQTEEITLMSNEDHRNVLPKSQKQVTATEEAINRFRRMEIGQINVVY